MKLHWLTDEHVPMVADVPDNSVSVHVFAPCPTCGPTNEIQTIDFDERRFYCESANGLRAAHDMPALMHRVARDQQAIEVFDRTGAVTQRCVGVPVTSEAPL